MFSALSGRVKRTGDKVKRSVNDVKDTVKDTVKDLGRGVGESVIEVADAVKVRGAVRCGPLGVAWRGVCDGRQPSRLRLSSASDRNRTLARQQQQPVPTPRLTFPYLTTRRLLYKYFYYHTKKPPSGLLQTKLMDGGRVFGCPTNATKIPVCFFETRS